jgi:hypothetical protein
MQELGLERGAIRGSAIGADDRGVGIVTAP